MAYKDKIYDITALEMFNRLDVFLNNFLRNKKVQYSGLTVKEKICEFEKIAQEHQSSDMAQKMRFINEKRNKIVHPDNLENLVRFNVHPVQVLDLDGFKEFQRMCFALDDVYSEMRMKQMMIPTLKYQMGNAGDIIKHGLLAEFVQWYKSSEGGCLRFADPFGGCPWRDIPQDSNLRKQLLALKGTALSDAYPKNYDLYWGSSHLVRVLSEKYNLKTEIYIYDRDDNARCNLENSITEYKSVMEWDIPECVDGRPDAYAILDTQELPREYNLILIDPYSEFLLEESRNKQKRLNAALSLANQYPNLFIAIFVLDMKNNYIHDKFVKFRKKALETGNLLSLRCPKLKGEKYAYEMLLISGQLREKAADNLKIKLKKFAELANDALCVENRAIRNGGGEFSATEIKHWGLDTE